MSKDKELWEQLEKYAAISHKYTKEEIRLLMRESEKSRIRSKIRARQARKTILREQAIQNHKFPKFISRWLVSRWLFRFVLEITGMQNDFTKQIVTLHSAASGLFEHAIFTRIEIDWGKLDLKLVGSKYCYIDLLGFIRYPDNFEIVYSDDRWVVKTCSDKQHPKSFDKLASVIDMLAKND